MDRKGLRWGGWGSADRRRELTPAEQAFIADALDFPGKTLPETPAPALRDIVVPPASLAADALHRLVGAIGEEPVRTGHFERVFHARGQSYHDLLHYRSGQLDAAPDAVVYPTTAQQVVKILEWAEDHAVTVVPFGGGTSVVGGVTARCGPGHDGVVTLDTSRLASAREIDPAAGRARFDAGIYGPRLEAALERCNATLGHFPQSFEYSTLGGWIAARGAGHQSNGYGTAEDWFVGARCATARGLWFSETSPGSAAGPRIGDLLVGSEGTLAVMTDAWVRIRPRPAHVDLRAYLFPDFAAGLAAARDISQTECGVSMLRLSDRDETHFQSRFAGLDHNPGLAERVFKWFLGKRGYGPGACLMIVGSDGEVRSVDRTIRQVRWIASRHDGVGLGRRPGTAWERSRFAAPFLRDPLLDRGIGVDTLETAATWDSLAPLYDAVVKAIRGALGPRGIVMAHVSHTYCDGASLYFTCVFPRDESDPIGQWLRIKQAAGDAIVDHGGTISHHHGVGEDHLDWMTREKDPQALEVLRAVKGALDPGGHLNPGKLLPG